MLFGIHTMLASKASPVSAARTHSSCRGSSHIRFFVSFRLRKSPTELPQNGCHLMPYVLESLGRLVGGCAELGDAKSPDADAGPTSGRSAALDSSDDELSERIDHIFSRGQARAILSRRLGINPRRRCSLPYGVSL